MEITLVRHGQTEYNYQNRLQGITNVMLNDTGRRQAHKLKEKIKNEKYDICFSSPLIRALETAMMLVGDRVEIIRDNRLIERNLGDYEGKDAKDYSSDNYWDYNLNCGDKGVEAVKDLLKRCQNFLDYIETYHKDKKILVVSHGAVIRGLHHLLNKTDLNGNLTNFKIDNCYIEKINTK